jgi:hypothetical protein
MMSLNETVACAVNGLTAGVFSKEEVKESITGFVNKNYFRISEELPVSVFQALHEAMGMTFEIHDGKVSGVNVEGGLM